MHTYGNSHPGAGVDQESRPWALITGASDGLGLAWGQELAADGFNVILHGRNAKKLDGIKKDLEQEYNIRVRTLVFDAELMPTSLEAGAYNDFDNLIHDTIAGISLTILINNIGFLGRWIAHADRDPLWMDRQISMNVRFMAHLTRNLIPVLSANKPGLILNISSGAEMLPMPWSVTYAGAKGWSSGFNRTLKYEMKLDNTGVEVLGLIYSFLATPSTGRTDADATWSCPTARHAARAGLNAVGCGYQAVFPWWGHSLQIAFAGMLPEGIRDNFAAGVLAEQRKKMDALDADQAKAASVSS